MPRYSYLTAILFITMVAANARAGDWPAWRSDAQRSAATSDELPAKLRLQWTRELPPLKPAWADQPKMQFDAVYEPIVLGQRLFIGSPHDGSVTAYDTRTGDQRWRFYTDGPVRLPPCGWNDKLYCTSDDGYLYCLNAADGSLVWRFRGGPSDRKLLGNERLISTWPARGAPVVADGKVYFAAGIWPFMGIFLHALDAETGRVVWTNDGDGSLYIKQPHNSDSFAGVAPQGALAVAGDKLLVPGGRSVPACYDRATGRLLYYQLAENGKKGGGSAVAVADQLLLNGGAAFDLATEKHLGVVGDLLTFGDGQLYDHADGKLRVLDLASSKAKLVNVIDLKGVKSKVAKWTIDELSKPETSKLTALIKAGSRLYAGTVGGLLAYDLPLPTKGKAEPAWEIEVDGTPASVIAADERLFAVTREGRIYCFGGDELTKSSAPPTHKLPNAELAVEQEWSSKASEIQQATGIDEGYCLAWGVGSGGLVKALLRSTALRIVVIEPDVQKANAFRDELRRSSVGGDRASLIVADPITVELPPYLANLMVAESLPQLTGKDRDGFIVRMFASLRPYGGVACLPLASDERDACSESIKKLQLAGAVCKPTGEWMMLAREGALPDTANWTHEHADAANTRVSKDKVVKAPLGLLWFGGPTNSAVLPRHGHGPQPQVVDGRLFIEGPDMIRGMDIYTGRLLWEAKMPGVGALYDNALHQPGANSTGTNYVATTDGIYVAYRDACWRLDPVTGRKLGEFKLPGDADSKAAPLWGYLNVSGDYLVGGAEPLYDASRGKGNAGNKLFKTDNDNFSSSGRLVVMDRTSGKVLWTAEATSGFRHNAICVGGGRLYAIDRLSGAQLSHFKRRGEKPSQPARLVAFDLRTGAEVWHTEADVFGTWLSYSDEHDVLVEAGRTARDTMLDEPKGMRAYRAGDGSMLWENKSFEGPAMLHHDTVLMAGKACDLRTGAPRMREHPLTGESVEWAWTRNYGCNTPAASEHLLTFRSGAAGYFDLCNDGGTGNFGGFRSSCTNNLIVAGGVLSAPDYTRTCTCSYQNQTSLAMVHMPDAETWTSFGAQTPKAPVRRLGINLGAPGDRKADDGTLWLEYPSVGGSSPAVKVEIEPKGVEWFRRHSSQASGDGPGWVASSGAIGVTSLRVRLADSDDQPRRYMVRLHFMEPDDVKPGERTFGVRLQGKPVLALLDIVKEAGGRNRSLVKEFSGIQVAGELVVEFASDPTARLQSAVLSGVEIQAEGW